MKKTLRELIDVQRVNGATDFQVIEAYFTLNNLEEEAIDLISQLAQSRISKIKDRYLMAEVWVCTLPQKDLYEHYDFDTAEHLHKLELNFVMNDGKLSEEYLKWAKENIPNIKMPVCYFRPLIDWMQKRNISFKTN